MTNISFFAKFQLHIESDCMDFFSSSLLSRVSADSDFSKLFSGKYRRVESCVNCRDVRNCEGNLSFGSITLPFTCNSISEYMDKVCFQTGHIVDECKNRRDLEVVTSSEYPLDCVLCGSGLSDDVMQIDTFPTFLTFCTEVKSEDREVDVKTARSKKTTTEFKQFILKNKVFF